MLMRAEIKAAIEALLFASGERVSGQELAASLDIPSADVKEIISEMMSEYNQASRGIQIIALEEGYILGTKAEYAQIVNRMLKPSGRRLSPAALETMAIIAYRQPVSKVEIEQIRGVKTDRVMVTLQEKGLIKELGKKAAPGKPMLYGTTHEFLRLFGLSSLDELPAIENEEDV